ncbi:hypothetical protein Q3G72_003954 [Acer saccharum]|nr:hypothetical protein Q3G72_003954 [Acer saccharum]
MLMFIVQEELYDLILQTNKECLKLCKPGANLLDIHHYSDSTKNRDILGALWDKLSVDETKEEIILFKVVTLEENASCDQLNERHALEAISCTGRSVSRRALRNFEAVVQLVAAFTLMQLSIPIPWLKLFSKDSLCLISFGIDPVRACFHNGKGKSKHRYVIHTPPTTFTS